MQYSPFDQLKAVVPSGCPGDSVHSSRTENETANYVSGTICCWLRSAFSSEASGTPLLEMNLLGEICWQNPDESKTAFCFTDLNCLLNENIEKWMC